MRIAALALLLAGCAAVTPAGSEEAAFVAAGAERVPGADRAELLVGNSVVGHGFTVHYAPDGRKLVALADGRRLERRWRIRADGIFCEELAKSGAEVCAVAGKLYVLDGEYRAFRPDGNAAGPGFRVVAGEATAQ